MEACVFIYLNFLIKNFKFASLDTKSLPVEFDTGPYQWFSIVHF